MQNCCLSTHYSCYEDESLSLDMLRRILKGKIFKIRLKRRRRLNLPHKEPLRLEDLPPEVIAHIAQFLPVWSTNALSWTSRTIHSACQPVTPRWRNLDESNMNDVLSKIQSGPGAQARDTIHYGNGADVWLTTKDLKIHVSDNKTWTVHENMSTQLRGILSRLPLLQNLTLRNAYGDWRRPGYQGIDGKVGLNILCQLVGDRLETLVAGWGIFASISAVRKFGFSYTISISINNCFRWNTSLGLA